jgi:hypothetical protein
MKEQHFIKLMITRISIVIILFCLSASANAQEKLKFGVHADPVISWFSTNTDVVSNQGSRPGFNFGIGVNRFFSSNYAFSTGINLISAGGRLISDSTSIFDLSYSNTTKQVTVKSGDAIVYKIQYLSVPLGLKLQTNQIGYLRFFTDIGVDPKVVIGGKADIPSLDIKGQSANKEIGFFNLSYHIMAGIEYGIGGNTAVVLGLGFDNNFIDITTDKGNQPDDKISQKQFSFRLGINF